MGLPVHPSFPEVSPEVRVVAPSDVPVVAVVINVIPVNTGVVAICVADDFVDAFVGALDFFVAVVVVAIAVAACLGHALQL